jgi:hypothetical protein
MLCPLDTTQIAVDLELSFQAKFGVEESSWNHISWNMRDIHVGWNVSVTNYGPVHFHFVIKYEGVSRSFRTGHRERELQMVQLSDTRCTCIPILWISLVSFSAITLYVASQRVFIVVDFFIDSVRKLLDSPSYVLGTKYMGFFLTEHHAM